MRLALLSACALALAASTSAEAKEIMRIAVVGADGRSAELAVKGAIRRDFYPRRYRLAHPRGPHLLVYTLLDVGALPSAVHGYYPSVRVLCPSVARPGALCPAVSAVLARRLASLRLTPFARRPTTIVWLARGSRPIRAPSHLSRAFELAFGRTRAARAAHYPRQCAHAYSAVWRGPGSRPRRFCLGRLGLYARGRIYPTPPGLYEIATAF